MLDILVNLVSFLLVILATPLLLAQVRRSFRCSPPRPAPWQATVTLTDAGIFVSDRGAQLHDRLQHVQPAGPTLAPRP
ncbi:MAG: hypothetical protein H6723_19200 [Sandaracinus sp.]|nr:hypothetical protein [Sandaracinus sp.]